MRVCVSETQVCATPANFDLQPVMFFFLCVCLFLFLKAPIHMRVSTYYCVRIPVCLFMFLSRWFRHAHRHVVYIKTMNQKKEKKETDLIPPMRTCTCTCILVVIDEYFTKPL